MREKPWECIVANLGDREREKNNLFTRLAAVIVPIFTSLHLLLQHGCTVPLSLLFMLLDTWGCSAHLDFKSPAPSQTCQTTLTCIATLNLDNSRIVVTG